MLCLLRWNAYFNPNLFIIFNAEQINLFSLNIFLNLNLLISFFLQIISKIALQKNMCISLAAWTLWKLRLSNQPASFLSRPEKLWLPASSCKVKQYRLDKPFILYLPVNPAWLIIVEPKELSSFNWTFIPLISWTLQQSKLLSMSF